MSVQATFAATLVDEWARCGVEHAVVSPGSRSTPLAVALATDERLSVHVLLDERSAGFFALGVALGSGRPAVVLTTSGTAAAELHPAVIEAHQAGVPLIACTADRPVELHHVGAPQTVEQTRLFEGAVRWAFEPGVGDAVASGSWRSMAARAVAEATGGPRGPGPVHLNLAFREPLVGEPGELPPPRSGTDPWHRREPGRAWPSEAVVAELSAGGRGLIVAGAGAADAASVHRLAEALGWPVLAEPRSGCRVPEPATVAAADALLRVPEFAARHRPEIVLRLGAPWASRVVAEWLASLDVPQYLVDPYGTWMDPGRSASVVIGAHPYEACEALIAATPRRSPPEWLAAWQGAESAAQAAIDKVLAGYQQPTEPAVARSLVAALPDEAALVVSSSMPVRDVEWYARPRRGVRFLANRGTNGIDGVVSTAAGVAAAWPGPTVALMGDLAFLYDTGGLLERPPVDRDCKLVVVDNDGGGIFSFLPQAGLLPPDRFERLLGTPHGLDLCDVARAHGVPARQVAAVDEVVDTVVDSGGDHGMEVVVVRTDRAANVAVHDELHAAVADAVT